MSINRENHVPIVQVLPAVVLVAAVITFGFGIGLPIIAFERFYFLSDSYSIISLARTLWGEGEWLLVVIVGGFSIVLPGIKLLVLALAMGNTRSGRTNKPQRVLTALGRWSMMDVLIVALLIVAAKTSGVATALSQPGLYCYAASVVLTMLVTTLHRRGLGKTYTK